MSIDKRSPRPRRSWVRSIGLLGFSTSVLASTEEDRAVLTENEQLRKRLEALTKQLEDERQYSYLRSTGYLSGAETIFMETMEPAEAKQWCNAKVECKGFTYLAPVDGDPDEEQEVTVTFKGEGQAGEVLRVDPDPSMISYVKAAAADGVFGSVGDAAMQFAGASGQAVVSQWMTFQSVCLLLAIGVAAFVGRRRIFGDNSAHLPLSKEPT